MDNTMAREIDYNGPAWATERRDSGDGGLPWFVAPVGRGYTVPGASMETPLVPGYDCGPMTFEIVATPNDGDKPREPFIDQLGDFYATFADADAMRRYARVLLEVADHADIILGGAR